jgi:hypothetical protein
MFNRFQINLNPGKKIYYGSEILHHSHAQIQNLFSIKSNSNFSKSHFSYEETLQNKKIIFKDHLLTKSLIKMNYVRYLERFCFTNEWNNLGYGRITLPCDLSAPTSLWYNFPSLPLNLPEKNVLAAVFDEGSSQEINIYCAIWDFEEESVLWFNREMGPVDGHEIRIIEDFLSEYRPHELPCYPIISEIPFGFDAACTMRIDCDENIKSGRELFQLYQKKNIPFSLAVKTQQEITQNDEDFMVEVIKNGGSVVSHSHTHAPDWGGSFQNTLEEIKISQSILKKHLGDLFCTDYVVSPFHQNSFEAVKALYESGIKGFVGGIIHNDPEYLQFRSGKVYGIDNDDFFTHSQQCMFHGDCYLRNENNPLAIYQQSYRWHVGSETFFGFLDHPFSVYSYGWLTEVERCKAHESFLDFIKMESEENNYKVWFASLKEALDFLRKKNLTTVSWCAQKKKIIWEKSKYLNSALSCSQTNLQFQMPSLKARFMGEVFMEN